MEYFNSFYRSTEGRKFNTWCNYTTRLDTYGCGCEHECSYCYAKSLLTFRGNWKQSPKIADIVKVKQKISSLRPGSIVRMGGMTDCFQPIERVNELTYKTIKLLNYYKIHYLIVTKSSLVIDEKYLKIYDKTLAHFQISISNTENKYECASNVFKRIRSIELLQTLGFDVSIRLSPFLYNDCNIDTINMINCDKILIEFLKVSSFIKSHFNINYDDYTLRYGGYLNLQLDHKIKLLTNIKSNKQISVGEYVKPHYEYFRDNVNFNKQDCCNVAYKPNPITNNQLNLFADGCI